MKNIQTIIMAPLRGVTTYQFRKSYAHFFGGVDRAMAPFIPLAQSNSVSDRGLRDLLPENNEHVYPITPQVLGNNPAVLPPYLDKFFDLGLREVNWNLGCPAPTVTKKAKGSALIGAPELVRPFLLALNEDGRFAVSVKARLGLDSPDELFALIPLLEEMKISELIIHPRLAVQDYRGEANREAFKRIQESTILRCVYNGDLFTLPRCIETEELFGIDLSRVMVGRGLLINPYLPHLMKGGTLPQNPNKEIATFLAFLFEEYRSSFSGVVPVFGRLKEYWHYLKFSFPGSDKLVKKLMKATDEQRFHAVTQEILETIPFHPPLTNPSIDY